MNSNAFTGSEDVFKYMGFTCAPQDSSAEVSTINPPPASNPKALSALLRAWIELSAYISAVRLNRSGMLAHLYPVSDFDLSPNAAANQSASRRLYAEVQPVRDIVASSIGSAYHQSECKAVCAKQRCRLRIWSQYVEITIIPGGNSRTFRNSTKC